MEQKLKELKTEVRSLLEEHQEGININSFWGLYERKYHKLPDPKVFRVKKRSEILDVCSDVCRKVGFGATALIHLKSSDHSDRLQSHVSRGVEGAAVGGRENERMQTQSHRPQMLADTLNTRQLTPMQAGMKEFSTGGSFYDRFYSQSDKDRDSVAKAGSGTRNVTNPAGPGSYSSLMGAYSRPAAAAAAAVHSSASASYPGIPVEPFEPFAKPTSLFGWSTPSASGSAVGQQHYQTPRSRDSSGSRSSDGASNRSPAPGGRHSDQYVVPLSAVVVSRSSARAPMTGVIGGRGRRTNYSREQLNSAAEDCIDRLSVAKDYVSLEKISRLLCQDFGVSSLDELGLHRIDELTCVNEHNRLECKVNAYIQNFVKVGLLQSHNCSYI